MAYKKASSFFPKKPSAQIKLAFLKKCHLLTLKLFLLLKMNSCVCHQFYCFLMENHKGGTLLSNLDKDNWHQRKQLLVIFHCSF